MDEVLKTVTGVNWRGLGKELIGEGRISIVLHDSDDYDARTDLDRIHDEHESDEARLRAVVEKFLTKSDRSWRGPPTWRRVIWALYGVHEIDKAQQIRSYAEPLQSMLE